MKHWMSMGAQISGTVNNLLVTKGIIQGKKINVLSRKTLKGAEGTQKVAEVGTAGPVAAEPVAEEAKTE